MWWSIQYHSLATVFNHENVKIARFVKCQHLYETITRNKWFAIHDVAQIDWSDHLKRWMVGWRGMPKQNIKIGNFVHQPPISLYCIFLFLPTPSRKLRTYTSHSHSRRQTRNSVEYGLHTFFFFFRELFSEMVLQFYNWADIGLRFFSFTYYIILNFSDITQRITMSVFT